MNLREIYGLYGGAGSRSERAREVLHQRHWFTELAEFDPRTGRALTLDVDTVLRRLSGLPDSEVVKDRLWRIVDHCRESILKIISLIDEDPRREQSLLPLQAARELNATSFIALNRRPGRNIREKLAYKPYVQAVRRFQSVDLPQNRLFKEFVTRLVELLELRSQCLGDVDELVTDIRRWLRGDEAQSISKWQNVPANNTLLSHKEYRRIWDAWRWLQELDDDLDRDSEQVETYSVTIDYWSGLAAEFAEGDTLFGNIPVTFDYDSFSIEPWLTPIPRVRGSVRMLEGFPIFNRATCVDITSVNPTIAVDQLNAHNFGEYFVWQRWSNGTTVADIERFRTNIVVQHPDATSITIPELFSDSNADEHLREQAAFAFCRHLKNRIGNDDLVWLAPDSLSDFELVTIRRNLNAHFGRAEPVPRSIAAALENVDYSQIRNDDFRVAIVDSFGGTIYSTILTAQYDQELQECVPETRGFRWLRSPYTELSSDDSSFDPIQMVARFDTAWDVFVEAKTVAPPDFQGRIAQYEREIGAYDEVIFVDTSPVRGGLKLHELQKQAGDIPLWHDNMPRLSIKILKDGRRVHKILVDSKTTVRPIRGREVPIQVTDSFTLPRGQSVPRFPLFQGEKNQDSGFEAELRSPAFPLDEDTDCDLLLTYTYGADDPYRLEFVPKERQFPPVRARWHRRASEDLEESQAIQAPSFPVRETWHELRRHPRLKPDPHTGSMERDLLDWMSGALDYLEGSDGLMDSIGSGTGEIDVAVNEILKQRVLGVIKVVKTDRYGGVYYWVDCGFGPKVFCHENEIVDRFNKDDVKPDDEILLYVENYDEKFTGKFASFSEGTSPELVKAVRKFISGEKRRFAFEAGRAKDLLFKARYPSLRIWLYGRSIHEADCPEQFVSTVTEGVARCEVLYHLAQRSEKPELKKLGDEIFIFLCRLHIDSPTFIHDILLDAVDKKEISYPEAQGLAGAIGSCSEDWQKRALNKIVAGNSKFKYFILREVFWRSSEPVHSLDALQLESLLSDLQQRFRSEIESFKGKKSAKSARNIFHYLEVLLALLRTRESPDLTLRGLLSPSSKFRDAFESLIDEIPELKPAEVPTWRAEISVEKPEEYRKVSDLEYAVRLYLTNDDGASAVRITGIKDAPDEKELQ